VLIVGGGVVGCASAWFLAREGVSVTLVEREDVAAQASGAAAGMLLPYGEAEREGPFLDWCERSLALFPELCAELRERSGVDPEFEASGALHVAASAGEAARLRARQQRFAGRDLEWLDAEGLRDLDAQLAPALAGGLFSPREAHVRPPLLAQAYAAAALEIGARIERGVSSVGLRRAGGRVTGVDTSAGVREAGTVLLCAGVWTPAAAPIALPIEPVRGQILSLDNCQPPLRHIVVGGGTYLVPKRDGRVVVGATEERVGFDRRVTAGGLASLLEAAPRLVPALADCAFRDAWAGLRPCTPDHLPAIGRVPDAPGLMVAAGHHRNGVLLSPVTGRLVADLVLGKPPEAGAEAFDPARFA
jgi:glycine oxidase